LAAAANSEIAPRKKGHGPGAEISRANGRKGGKPYGVGLKPVVRRIIDKIIDEEETPLDVMVDNMKFWRHAAEAAGDRLQALLSDAQAEGTQIDLREAMKLTSQLLAARENSQKCAVEAAPYVHPKLASIQMNMTNQTPPREIDEAQDTPEQAAEAWAAMVSTS
jgi:hypothetical protein